MKRFVLLAMLAMTWWCVPAFGAESIRILRNGEEVRLSQGILRQDGTLMMSIQDLAELTESELRGWQRNCIRLPLEGGTCRSGK